VGDQLLITILKLNAREAYLVQSVETYCECPGISTLRVNARYRSRGGPLGK